MKKRQDGFTIVELLVVITIIVVLLALLLPSLERAVQSAEIAVCLSNQHKIGLALHGYQTDHKRYYPVLDTWWGLMGQREAPPPWVVVPSDVTDRPLNAYLGYTSNGSQVPVARCPSDQGDPLPLVQNDNDYRTVGTSYMCAFSPQPQPDGYVGVKIIFGFSGSNPRLAWVWNIQPLPSEKVTSLERLDNKAVVMDANWHADRPTDSPQTRWHRPDRPERYLSTLFGDSHAELFDWDREFVDTYDVTHRTPYNSGWKWW